MNERHTALRSMHDVGLAAWFGGSLMGAIGLNRAASNAKDPAERSSLASDGWSKWTPVNAAAIGAHLIGATGQMLTERKRLAGQAGVGTMSAAKTALTLAALGATGYGRALGKKIENANGTPVKGVTEPSEQTPQEVAAAQKRLRAIQWAIPALTGALVVMTSFAGEQQRPGQVAKGVRRRIMGLLIPGK